MPLKLIVAHVVEPGHDGLHHRRARVGSLAAQNRIVRRHLAPGDEAEAFFFHRLDHDLLDLRLRQVVVAGHEKHADRQVLFLRDDAGSVRLEVRPKQLVRQLRHHARAVTGARIGVDRPAVRQVFQRGERVFQHIVRTRAIGAGNKAHAAGVVLERLVVEG